MSRPIDRQCCDGLCLQGRVCPQIAGRQAPLRFAPGVIDGPARRRSLVRRVLDRLRAAQP